MKPVGPNQSASTIKSLSLRYYFYSDSFLDIFVFGAMHDMTSCNSWSTIQREEGLRGGGWVVGGAR